MIAAYKSSPKAFLTVPEVADLLQVSERTVRRWISAKELPAHHIGRSVRIARDDLDLFMAKRRRGGSVHDL